MHHSIWKCLFGNHLWGKMEAIGLKGKYYQDYGVFYEAMYEKRCKCCGRTKRAKRTMRNRFADASKTNDAPVLKAAAQYKEPSVMCMECKYAEEIPWENLWVYRLIRCKHPNKPTEEIKFYSRDGCDFGKKARDE